MKNFIASFFMCVIVGYLFLFFGGALVFDNIFGMLIFVSLILAIWITGFMEQESKIEQLQKRIEELEAQKDKSE